MSSDDNASMDALERAASLGKADATAFEGLEGLNDKAEALTVSQPMEPTMERQVEKVRALESLSSGSACRSANTLAAARLGPRGRVLQDHEEQV